MVKVKHPYELLQLVDSGWGGEILDGLNLGWKGLDAFAGHLVA